MPNHTKLNFLEELRTRLGRVRKLDRTQSLFEVGEGSVRVYIRYSRLHSDKETFYGLRQLDLQLLEGRRAFICFLWDGWASRAVACAVF